MSRDDGNSRDYEDHRTIATRETKKTAVQMKRTNIILESDPQVTILSIMDKMVALKHISNLVDGIKCIARNFDKYHILLL